MLKLTQVFDQVAHRFECVFRGIVNSDYPIGTALVNLEEIEKIVANFREAVRLRSETKYQKLDDINSHSTINISLLKDYFNLKSEHQQTHEDDKTALRSYKALKIELDEMKTIAKEIDSEYEI